MKDFSTPSRSKPYVFLIFIAGLLILVSGLKVWSLTFMTGMPISGDEAHYAAGAAAMAEILTGGNATGQSLADTLIGWGWFMPGMSFLLLPLFIIDQDPSLAVMRSYVAGLTFIVWIWTLAEIWRHTQRTFERCGDVYGGLLITLMFLICPSLVLTWNFFAAALWADTIAGLLLVIILMRLFSLSDEIIRGAALKIRKIIWLAFLFAALTYLRGSLIFFVLAGFAWLSLVSCLVRPKGSRIMGLAKIAGGLSVFCVLLIPWSLAISTYVGSPTLTTTTMRLSPAVSFGDESRLCLGPCPEGNIWIESARFSRSHARQTGQSEADIQKQMSAAALEGLTPKIYAGKVREHFVSFFFNPHEFNRRFVRRNDHVQQAQKDRLQARFNFLTQLIYLPFLAALFIAIFLILRRDFRLQVLSLLIKMITICMSVQIFVHVSHGRYWSTLTGVMALSAAMIILLIITSIRGSKPDEVNKGAIADLPHVQTVMTALQGAYVVGICLVTGLILLL